MSRGRRISRVKFITPSATTAAKYLHEWNNKVLFHHPEQFPKLTSVALFNQPGLISLDIGCGTGEFTNAIAKENADKNYVGIEISRRAIYHAVYTAAQKHLANIVFIKADFKLLAPLFAPTSLENVYLNFPDPNYGGENRRKHRIFNQSFLDQMDFALSPTGLLHVVTDQEDFLSDMLEIAENDSRFCKNHSSRYLEDFSPPEKTRFQRAWEKFDRPVFRFELKKSPLRENNS